MGTVAAVIFWVGAIACSAYFWFTYARTRSGQSPPVKRLMTMLVFIGWPLYLGYQVLRRRPSGSSAPVEGDAKQRILG
jgi:hypothetical protein